jgi:hypothetical protein
MTFRTTKIPVYLFALTLMTSVAGFADVVTGTFSIGGGTANVGLTSIVWQCLTLDGLTPPCPSNPAEPAGSNSQGDFVATQPISADPSLPTEGEGGFITELTSATTPVGPAGFAPVMNWLTVGDVALDLTNLPAGSFGAIDCVLPAAPGQTCTPIIGGQKSNLNLSNTSTGFTASFDVAGMARDLDGGPNNVSKFTGTFTATINGETYQQALAAVLAGTAVPFPYTANFVLTAASVPEPSFLPILGGAMMLLAFVGIYRRKVRGQQ